MSPLTPLFSRISHILLVIAIASLAATLAGLSFVGAQSEVSEASRASFTTSSSEASTRARIAERFGKLPLSFESNQGQTADSVKFLSHGPGYDLFLTATETVLSLRKPQNASERSVLRLKMIGANADPRVEGRDELPGKVNYFVGNDSEKWRRNVPTYRKVHYANVYPGIDVVYYGNQRELEYDFVVAAGANPKLIKFSVDGALLIRLDGKGNLVAALKHGEVQLNKPFVYQLADDGSRSEVKGSYVINGNVVSFKVRGADSSKPLVIDPVLSYSTYLGGNGSDAAFGIAVDAEGSAYVTGQADFSGFPTTPGAFKTSDFGGAFVTKLDPTGSTLVYSTFLNGNGQSGGFSIALDASENAYVTGFTSATDFPVVNGLKTSSHFFKTTNSGSNWNNLNSGLVGSVSALAVAPSTPNIIYAQTQNGPFRSTDAGATWTKTPTTGLPSAVHSTVAVDPNNALLVYVGLFFDGLFKSSDGGNTWSAVPLGQSSLDVTTIVFDPSTPSTIYVGSNKGVFKSTNSGATWTVLNNFGTPTIPIVKAIAVDPTTPTTVYAGTLGNGGLYKSTNGGSNWTVMNSGISGGEFSIVNAIVIDPSNPSTIYTGHGFSGAVNGVSKSTNGGTLWTPINNGVGNDRVNALVIDRTNTSTLFAATETNGILKTTNGGAAWTTANTGFWRTDVRALVGHPSNAAMLFAGTAGNFFDLPRDAFVSKLNPTGSGLLFSTYLGGSALESGNGIAVDNSGNIVVVGETTSPNFPTVNALQSAFSATENCSSGFVTKLNPSAPAYVFSTYLGGSRCDVAHDVALDSSANVYVTGNTKSTDFPIAGAFQATIGDTLRGDAFVTKLTSGGSLTYSTYLGGDNEDIGFSIAIDVSGNAYVTGDTASTNFPTANPIQSSSVGSGAFVTKLNSSGSGLVYSTYLAGAAARGIAVDATGSAYVTGFGGSLDFPIVAGALRTRSALFKSVDGAANWGNDNYGLRASNVTHLAVHPTQPSTLYAGTIGVGVFRSTDAGKTWSAINNGMSGSVVSALIIDPLTPSTVYVACSNEFGTSGGGVYKSTDGGNSWNLRTTGMTNTDVLSLALDPVTPTKLYAGVNGGGIFKTTNGADNWAPSGTTPPSFPVGLAVDPHMPTRVFAVNSSSLGGVFRSIDSGASWQSVGIGPTSAHGTFIAVSPHTPNLVYATMSGSGLFKSVDGGDTWSSVRPEARFAKIFFDPVSASTLYLVSRFEGVLKSTDSGQTWIPMNNGLTVPEANALAINPLRPSTLYAAEGAAFDEDAFVTKINPAGSAVIYSTFLGGIPASNDSLNTNDQAYGIAIDSAGNAYVTGLARSPFFPTTPNGFQPFNRGFNDAFISKLTMSHIIRGHVSEAGGAPVNGAEVVLSDGASLTTVVTDTDGSYEFSHLRQGGSFTVGASKSHFTMTPPIQSFNNLNADHVLNFTATATNAPFFTISGQVTSNAAGLAGVTVTLSGTQLGTRTTDSSGNYSFEVSGGGNYTVTPSVIGFTFGPTNQTFNNLSAPQTANFAGTRQSFVVTNVNNHGTGSLREAIVNANATLGADTIVFNIPGPGVKTINLVTPLPEITEAVVIDASTQPGYAGAPLVELDGSSLGFNENGVTIVAGGVTVRGLAIGRFKASGILVRSGNNVIQGNYIGIDATGSLARPNSTGIFLESSNNTIGGPSAAARNVISGNSRNGIEVHSAGNVIQGNYIGTNAAGTAAVGNSESGVLIVGTPVTNNLVGGSSTGAGNLISGNSRGISIEASGNTIQGNLIGTDAAGVNKIPNHFGIVSNSPNTLIGGLTAGARNVISGNFEGVIIDGTGSKLQGNFIGTDITGTIGMGNSNRGVSVSGGVLIGGTVPEARNVISTNGLANITLVSHSSGESVTVQGNYIGTDVTGSRALTDSSIILNTTGIAVFSSKNVIGGVVPGARNVISGNFVGILLTSSASQNVMQGNIIGLNALGTDAVPNHQSGIEFFFDAFDNVVGGTQSGAANKIAFNGFRGVSVANAGVRNSIRGNSIFSNGGLGIDLGAFGVQPNDNGDPDSGANNLQNFPVLTSVTPAANSTTIQGSLNSTPNTTFQIDFYSSAALDPSGNGEGALFLGTTAITTDSSGNATINASLPLAVGAGRVVTATATDPNGNTSEFSAGDPTVAAGSVQFSVNSLQVIEDVGLAKITVLRKGGATGTVSVDFATADATAIAGQDYTATSGTLTFSNGETTKIIQVPILTDAPTEPDETFTISLRNPSSVESLSPPTTVLVTIQDRTTVPFVFVDRRLILEGNAGTTTDVLFNATLSAQTGRTITVNFTTADNNASGGITCNNKGTDYETASGTRTFQPGDTMVTIPIKICGDDNAEANETFRITVSDSANGRVSSGNGGESLVLDEGIGTIVDDDVMEVLFEESPPVANQAAAIDALLFLRDPFRVTSLPDWLAVGQDRNTRVMFFVRHLELNPGESPSAVIVRLRNSNFQLIDVPAEDVRSAPNVDFTQVIMRLPDNLAPGTYTVTIRAHTRSSDTGTIRIAP